MRIIISLSILALLSIPLTARSDAGGGIAVRAGVMDVDGLTYVTSYIVPSYRFNSAASVEYRHIISSTEDARNGYNVAIDSSWAMLAKLTLPVTAESSINISYGHMATELVSNGVGRTISGSALGMGVSYRPLRNWQIGFELMKQDEQESYSFDVGLLF